MKKKENFVAYSSVTDLSLQFKTNVFILGGILTLKTLEFIEDVSHVNVISCI
jgi:hypothetical protein